MQRGLPNSPNRVLSGEARTGHAFSAIEENRACLSSIFYFVEAHRPAH